MAHLIDKDALIAEINRRIEEITQTISLGNKKVQKSGGNRRAELVKFLSFLNTLETKEVDLENEIKNLIEKEKAFVTDNREVKYYNGDSFNHIYELEFIAKHFFELGLKAQKGE